MPIDAALTSRFPLLEGIDSWDAIDTVPGARARMDAFEADDAPWAAPDVPHYDVPLSAAGHSFRVRVYGTGDGSAPALVWVHGGGFLAGDLEMRESDLVAREVAVRIGGVVVAVDYSLVPAVTYPVPHQQVVAAWRWTREHAEALGVHVDRVGLGGASAGGALSLAAARELAAEGEHPAVLVLAYPVAHRRWDVDADLDAAMAGVPPMFRYPPATVEQLNAGYLGETPSASFAFVDTADPAELAALPPTLVLVAEYDDLRTSANLYVRQARAAGGRVERVLVEGVLHGHLNRTPAFAPMDRSLADIARVVATGRVAPN